MPAHQHGLNYAPEVSALGDGTFRVDGLLFHMPGLWELAFRSDMVSRGRLDPDWKAAFEAHPDRFMVGTDTCAPERWYYVGPHADFSRMVGSAAGSDRRQHRLCQR